MRSPRLPTDLVLAGGPILTMDADRRRAEAVWVHGDRIAAIGNRDEIRATAPPEARTVDLGGAAIVPGFIDAHCHLGICGYLIDAADCTPLAAPDIPAILDRLRAASRTAEPGTWVIGQGFVEYRLAERRPPTRGELDQAVPDRPCILYHVSLHACVLNSAALTASGYADGDPDPPGGLLGRDASGRLDGRLFEAPMFRLLEEDAKRTMAAWPAERRADAMARAAGIFVAEGITSAMDADLPGLASFGALRDAELAGRLPLRLAVMINIRDADWAIEARLGSGFGSDWLRLGAVKIFADGGMSSRTAATEAEYPVAPYGRGVLFYSGSELTEMIRRADAAGFQVAIHAQGDRAIRTVLDAFERVMGRGSGNPRRHRIEHGGTFLPALIEQAAAIGIHVVSQPAFLSLLGDGFVEAFGNERAQLLYAFGSLRRAGLVVGGSSDAPVITASVRLGLRDAILRRTSSGAILGPGERLTALEALELYTRAAAYLTGSEEHLGSLEPGKLADFVILADDPTTIDPERLPELPIRQTVVGGIPVWGDGPI